MEGMTLEKLQVIIEAQTKQYMDAMKKVQNQTNSTVSKVNSSIGKIKGVLGAIGKVVGIAFSVAALVNFGKACINLGSDLAEVQNVVDVTFGAGNKTIEDFAKNAAEQFGLSELAAKQYTSTMGAMLKSMGITGNKLEEMSTQLAGLAGDMASFYNLDSDTAFAKLRSGISGETEPLKQLGINLSVANLEAYALSQGITKSYNSMTQQEQALLRYNYLLKVTADAQGDFARTSDSWANQTRILQLRFESLKATIGQGLINVFTPVIRVLNMLIAKLQVAADAFKRFTEIITGKSGKSASTSTGKIQTSLGGAADNANALTGATKAAGGAAKKAEEAYHGLGKFDEINSLTKAADSSGGGGGEDLGGAGDIPGVVDETATETDNELNPVLQKLIDRLKELRDLFMKGFKAGMGDVTLEPLKNAIASIKKSLIDIWTDPEVVKAANDCLDKWAYALGQITGAIAAIGITIATNLVGGLAKYLEQNTDRIKQFLISMFDISGSIAEITGNFAQAAANIFSVFGSDTGQQVTANLIGIFADAYMGVLEITGKATRDILDVFTRPFIDNQEEIKTALEGILSVFETVTGSIKDVVDQFVDGANAVYDEHFAPLFDSIAGGLSDTAAKFLEFWNGSVQPVLAELGAQFQQVMQQHVSPLVDRILEFAAVVGDALKALWEGVLKPLIDWIIANVLPKVLPVLETIWSTVQAVFGFICDLIGGLIEVITGIINFIVGIFTGDWERAWKGIEQIVEGVLSAISAFISLILQTISGIVVAALQAIYGFFSTIFNAIKSVVITIFNAIKTAITTVMQGIKNGLSTALSSIKTIWSNTWTNLKTTVVTIFNSMWSSIKGVINSIIGGIESMANAVVGGVNKVIDALNGLSFDIPDWVPEFGGKTFGFSIPKLSTVSLPRLAAGGIVDGATPLIAGEAGKEAIVPLERNTGWIDAIASKLAEILSINIIGAIENTQGGETEHTTVVELDGKTLVTQIDKYKKRSGYEMKPVPAT